MVFYDMQNFGGLEEYATNLAIGLANQGHQVSMLSAAWVSPTNQYARRLKAKNIRLVQPPAWISKPASDWATKEKILRIVMWFLWPLTCLLGIGVFLVKRRSLKQSWNSAYNWLKGQLMDHLIGPDRRKWLGCIFLYWWDFWWRPDIIHIHGYTTNLFSVVDWAYVNNIPVVYEEHQTPDSQFDWWKDFHHSINKATRVIAVSDRSAEALRQVCGITRPIVVRGPLLPDPFESGWHKNIDYQQHKPITITTIARLYVTKGLMYLLEAAALVKQTHPNVLFNVYGEGELRQELLERAQQLGLKGEEIFLGAFTDRKELSRIMAKTDIFLLPSILEGQPLVIVEAMAYGCPIVATAVGGIPELIQDGVNGLLCQPADPECLAQKIRILIDDSSLRARLGAAARASYERGPFQMNVVSAQFVSIYQDAIAEARSKQRCQPSQASH